MLPRKNGVMVNFQGVEWLYMVYDEVHVIHEIEKNDSIDTIYQRGIFEIFCFTKEDYEFVLDRIKYCNELAESSLIAKD